MPIRGIWRIAGFAILATVLMASAAAAQPRNTGQLQFLGGVYLPTDRLLQNMYGAAADFEIALSVPLGVRGRLRVFADASQASGDPYFELQDFDAGNAATMKRASLGVMLQVGSPFYAGPRVYLGAGMYGVLAREAIVGVSRNAGQGLGALLSLEAHFRLGGGLDFLIVPSMRFEQAVFRAGKARYRLNFNGGRLMVGLAFSPEG